MNTFNGKKGKWITSKGRHIFIEEGKTLNDAITEYDEAAKAKKLLHADITNEDDQDAVKAADAEIEKTISGCQSIIKSRSLPPGVKAVEYLGGTMDTNGKQVNMKKFKDGYLVSCGNASEPYKEQNRRFLLSEEGKRFIKDFVDKHSDDGTLYVGSWYEDGENTNEPTIWIKDRDKATKLAKLTGQYSITDCAEYNKHGCKNYTLLNEEQKKYRDDIFIPICDNAEHEVMLSKVKI